MDGRIVEILPKICWHDMNCTISWFVWGRDDLEATDDQHRLGQNSELLFLRLIRARTDQTSTLGLFWLLRPNAK